MGRWMKARRPAQGCLDEMRSPCQLPRGCWGGGPTWLPQHCTAAAAVWSCMVQVGNWLPCRLQSTSAPGLSWLGLTGASLSPTNHPKPSALEGTLPGGGLGTSSLYITPEGGGQRGWGPFPISLRCCLTWHSCFCALMPSQLPMPTQEPPGFREEPSKPQVLAPQGSAWWCWTAACATCSRLLVY